MVAAVEQDDAEIDHRIPSKKATRPRILDPLFHRRDEVTRDRAAEDVVDEFEVPVPRQGLDLDLAIAELAAPAGLLLVLPALRSSP